MEDPFLRRLEREAVIACVAMAGIALAARPARPSVALGVLGGGALAAVSYLAIKGGIDAATERAAERAADGARAARRRRKTLALVKFFTRYAILAVAAYAMIVRWRLHPVGVLAGASSIVLAAAAEALREATSKKSKS